MKYGELNLGQIEAIVNKLGGIDGVKKFLGGELIVSRPIKIWTEKDGIIRFSVTSDGTTGEEWIDRLEKKSFLLSDNAKSVLRSKNFKPTFGITYKIAVLKGQLFDENECITKNIRKEAKKRKFSIPNAEVACLVMDKFSDKELEAIRLCWIIVIEISSVAPSLFNAGRGGVRYWNGPRSEWFCGSGFAFVESQVSSS